ncbi:hypothetical protein [Paraliomyxa miuraensis]|uniref:hypothetical protein n=1 Tax=Paraliomyxa miuraensis TaxID=376150 RepID=UPI002254F612|nr:hypothetical protein [Paraliomyxa miuraensis]MCX4244635.1 hypothetical protein [Paraliomyxa miuraensis]
MRPPALALGSWLLLSTAGSGCASQAECSQASCESEAVVTFPADLFDGGLSGPFDLVIEGDGTTAIARCNDPSAPETADNPEGLACNGQGFTLDGHPLANEREVVVTIIRLETDEVVSESVRLDAIEEITPNGPDCPPLCVVRNGQLRTGVGS